MPTLGAALDFAKLEGRNFRGHQLGTAPASPVTGQLYYNTADNTLYWWDNSQWVSARGGAAATPPATTTSLGTIQLAGDLSGTATSPQIAAGVITDAEVATANKDGAVSVPGMRSLALAAPQKAMPGDASPALISNWNPSNADFNANGFKVVQVADPTTVSDAANKRYVDGVAQGLNAKQSVKAASTANLTLSAAQTVDGVALVAGDRCLVKDQSTPQNNGIYIVATGAWTRATDLDVWSEVPSAYVWVEQGTAQADTGWVSTADAGGTLNTTPMPWAQFSGAGSITAGSGLSKAGNTLNVGAGAGITVNADDIQVANNGITNAMLADGAVNLASADVTGTLPITGGGTGGATAAAARTNLGTPGYYQNAATHGAGATITIAAATHGLGAKRGIHVQVQDNATGNVEIPDISVAANGDVTITYAASVTANTKLVTLVG